MKKYYYNDEINNNKYSNDDRVPGARQVTACYKAYFTSTAPNACCTGYHSSWFCLKDGQYPIYYLSDNTHATFKGFRRICDFTVSSLSGQYYLVPEYTQSNAYTTYDVPYFMPYINKYDLYTNNTSIFEEFNPLSGNKLKWQMKPELIKKYNYSDGIGPNTWDSTSGFIFKNSMHGTANVNHQIIPYNVSGFFDKNRTYIDNKSSYILSYYSFMDFTNIEPTKMIDSIGGTYTKNTDANGLPPHYTIAIKDFDKSITGIKVKLNGLFLYSTFKYNNYPTLNDAFINNISSFDNGKKSPNCLAFFYQINEHDKWTWDEEPPYEDWPSTPTTNYLNGNFSGTVEYDPNGNGNHLKLKQGATITHKTYCLNALDMLEYQKISTPEFWNHVFVYSANTAIPTNFYKFTKHDDGLTGYAYMNSIVGLTNYTFEQITPENYSTKYNLTGKQFFGTVSNMNNLDTQTPVNHNENNRFIIYAGADAKDKTRYYKAYTYSYYNNITSTADDNKLIPLTSNYDYESEYGDDPNNPVTFNWNPYGNSPVPSEVKKTNFQFSDVMLEYTIPINYDADSGKYLHLSSPASTVLTNSTNSNSGLALEFIMSYEGVN